MSFNYTSTDESIVAAAQAFLDQKAQVASTAEAFCAKHNTGAPGFERSMVSGVYSFKAVQMTRAEWDEHHRKEWFYPSADDWAMPRRPKKGQKPSQLYTDYWEARKTEADPRAFYDAIGLNCGLYQPGFFIHDGALYIEHGVEITNPAMTEITQSAMQKAKSQHDATAH